MRIELRDQQRHRIGRVAVDPASRPTRVAVQADDGFLRSKLAGRSAQDHLHQPSGNGSPTPASREAFLNWDTALDDAGQLRRCVACGCTDLFKEKAFPQVTAFVVVLAFLGAVVGAAGLANTPPVLMAMAVILVLDVAILIFSRRRLVCYQCRTTFYDLAIARYHRSWDRSLADRHPVPPRESTDDRGVETPRAADSPTNAQPSEHSSPGEASPLETTNYFASS